jgi:hypothetical protein
VCVGASCSWSRHTRVCVFIVYNLSTSTSHNDPSLISSNLASLSALTKNSKISVKFVRKDLNEVILIDLGFGRAPIPLRVGGWGISAIGARTYARGRPGGDDRRRWTIPRCAHAHAHAHAARARRAGSPRSGLGRVVSHHGLLLIIPTIDNKDCDWAEPGLNTRRGGGEGSIAPRELDLHPP